jgi:hypothetical protein
MADVASEQVKLDPAASDKPGDSPGATPEVKEARPVQQTGSGSAADREEDAKKKDGGANPLDGKITPTESTGGQPAITQEARVILSKSSAPEADIAAIKNYFELGTRRIADLFEVNLTPRADDGENTAFCRNLEILVFGAGLPASGLLVVQYPNEEVFDALSSAALASARASRSEGSASVHQITVSFRKQQRDWIYPVISEIKSKMEASNSLIGILRPTPNSDLHGDFLSSAASIRNFDDLLKQSGRLLVVFLEDFPETRIEGRLETKNWILVRSETALAALFDQRENWVHEVKALVNRSGTSSVTYAQLRSACEAALKCGGDVGRFADALRNDAQSAKNMFVRALKEMQIYKSEGTFDMIGIFLAAYLPALSVSDFGKLAIRILKGLPPPPATDEKQVPWQWTPRELRRLTDAQLIELKAERDGSRRVYCASSVVADTIRSEFEREYISLTELRRDLLSESYFAEAELTREQMTSWVELVAQSQRDDPGTAAIRQLAEAFAADKLRRKNWLKEAGSRASVAVITLWASFPDQDGDKGQAASFIDWLIAEAGSDVAFQTLRFCCREASCPIPAKTLLNWISRLLNGSYKIPETLVYAFVRDVSTVIDGDRREAFISKLLDWILDEHEALELRQSLRDSLANAIWAALLTSADDVPTPLKVAELPIVGGLSVATSLRFLTCLLEDATVRIIDQNIRQAFGVAQEADMDSQPIDWLRLPSGFILVFLLAAWRELLIGDTGDESREDLAWLKALIESLKKDRERRRLLQQYLTRTAELIHNIKDMETDRGARKKYVELLKHLFWIRSELRADAQAAAPIEGTG